MKRLRSDTRHSQIAARQTAPLRLILLCLSVPLTFFVMVVSACSDRSDIKSVDFSRRITIVQPGEKTDQAPALRVAVGAMISPQKTFTYYHQLLEYIGRKNQLPIRMIQRKTYDEINQLLGSGQIDLAFICAGPYITGKDKYGFQALAIPIVQDESTYRAVLIVHQNSGYQNLEDLRGKVFAFTDPDSNAGKLVPTFWLRQIDETPERFFSRTIYSYSHDNAIMAVAESLVDAASVHNQVWEYLQRRYPVHTARTRVIKQSETFGNPPIVASRHLDETFRKHLQTVLLEMHREQEGRLILDELMIDRFIVPEISWYDSILEMINAF